MAIFSYRTIQQPAEGIYKEKGSTFISLAIPVETELKVKATLEEATSSTHTRIVVSYS